MKTSREQFSALLDTQQVAKGDVIFVMQGDGISRAAHAVDLYKRGFAPVIAIVGGADKRSYGSFPSREVRDEMVRLGVPQGAIHLEDAGAHTRAEADRCMELARENGWKTILIVTSPHHQYRAYLTFLKAMKDSHNALTLINTAAPLSWTEELSWGKRVDLLPQEFDKIIEYQKKGDVASYEEGIAYLASL